MRRQRRDVAHHQRQPQGGGGETIIQWHGNVDQERTATDAAAAKFNASGAGFKVKPVFVGNSDYILQKVLTATAAGKYPDITYLYGSWMANIAKSPKLVTLDDYIAQTPDFNWDDFFPAEREAATVDGKVVGIPALVDNLALVYNKDMFDKANLEYPTADWTWDDFRAAAQKLTDTAAGNYGWAYVNDASEDTVWRYLGHALAGRRRHPHARQHQGGLQLAGGSQGHDSCCATCRSPTRPSTSTTATATT